MTIHRSRPDADGNPGTTLCGTQLTKGRLDEDSRTRLPGL